MMAVVRPYQDLQGPAEKWTTSVTGRRFELLDGLRGIAAIAVLLWHCNIPGQELYWTGQLSVSLFFVISGFVIASAYEHKLRTGWRLSSFIATRLLRLWPLYLLGTFAGLAARIIGTVVDGRIEQANGYFALTFLALPLFPQPFSFHDPAFPLNNPGWSLFCEFCVNMAYAAIGFRLSSRHLARAAFVAWCMSLIIAATVGERVPVWSSAGTWLAMPLTFFTFATGVLLYRAWSNGHLPCLRAPSFVVVMVFVIVLAIAPYVGQPRIVELLVSTIAWPAVVAVAAQSAPKGKARALFAELASLSYPLYSTHWGWYVLASIVTAHLVLPHDIAYAIAVGAALLFAYGADRLYDRPIRAMLAARTRVIPPILEAAPPSV